ncbi:hypothetical protein FJT64_001397 [Amphibalanus amphitrite]|uniref:Uncharacterized protein n=1 Tax=Amphibalanus amphitrite TaxID=1232801 RepID=A0A6A4V4N9_AMPAM|nr:hypothetical protein FJT64_001397 [Amphibalanus amphitrite]
MSEILNVLLLLLALSLGELPLLAKGRYLGIIDGVSLGSFWDHRIAISSITLIIKLLLAGQQSEHMRLS